jgi:CRP-like cAMP-binding protein
VISAGAIHDRIIARLSRRHRLNEGDRRNIRALALEVRQLDASSHLVREGQRPQHCAFLIDGVAYRQKLTVDGRRSLCSLQVPGDFVDLQNIFLRESDHDVQALTAVVVAEIPIADLRLLADARPAVARAMWIDALIEGSIAREWLLNVGRRDARTRLAHLLCEFSTRLQATGLAPDRSFDLPMTQEQLGDALGLTAVHVNRVLKGLETSGLITRRKRQVSIADWPGLRRAADFNDRYLHFNQETG